MILKYMKIKGLELLDIEIELNDYYENRSCDNCMYNDDDTWCFDCCNFRFYKPKK